MANKQKMLELEIKRLCQTLWGFDYEKHPVYLSFARDESFSKLSLEEKLKLLQEFSRKSLPL